MPEVCGGGGVPRIDARGLPPTCRSPRLAPAFSRVIYCDDLWFTSRGLTISARRGRALKRSFGPEMNKGPLAQRYGDDRHLTGAAELSDGLRDLSDRLMKVIPSAVSSAPILITGDWGSGKSSLLDVTRGRLERSGHLTVWFDSWSYEGEGPLLPLLLRALWQRAPRELAKSREAKRKWENLQKAAGQLVKQKGPPVAALAGALFSPGLGFHAGHYLFHLMEPLVHRSEHGSQAYGADTVAVVQREFRWLIEKLSRERGRRPIIIFIDDLDRCDSLAALSLIESLRVLIGSSGSSNEVPVRYVVALDRVALVRAVTHKFSGMSSYDGNRYLEKIFPISFHLPRPEGAAILHFVQSFLGHDNQSKDAAEIGDILSLALADPVFANPRLMKRCIERFKMVLEFEATPTRDKPLGPAEQAYKDLFLAKWIAARERWPGLRDLFSLHDNDYWLKVGNHLSDRGAPLPDNDAAALLSEQDILIWLRKEFFGTKETRLNDYRDADRRLRRFGL